jgi:adenylate cyclase
MPVVLIHQSVWEMMQIPALTINAYTRRRLIASAKLGLVAVPFYLALRFIHGDSITFGSFILPLGLGFALGVVELFLLKGWLNDLPFFAHLAGKSLILFGVMYLGFAVLNLLDVFVGGITWQAYIQAIFEYKTLIGMVEGFGIIVILLFFIQLDRLLGPGVLLRFITGRYHHPRRELRIFMFLDLKGSTTLADEMDVFRYADFLHRYYTEMSEPILETGAEIYKYVGDEIILTWKMRRGLEEDSCIRLFFLIEDQINAHREHFLQAYGVVPEFKAGVHAGEIITAQMGELKSEIVYNGDVLNTTARIQALCNQFGQKLLVSAELMETLSLGPEYTVVELGPVPLRGKTEALELCAVNRTDI